MPRCGLGTPRTAARSLICKGKKQQSDASLKAPDVEYRRGSPRGGSNRSRTSPLIGAHTLSISMTFRRRRVLSFIIGGKFPRRRGLTGVNLTSNATGYTSA